MTKAEPSHPGEDAQASGPRLSPRDRLESIRRALVRRPLVRLGTDIVGGYNAAGGGLLSQGLAFGALFAIVPGILAIVGLLGLVIDDPAKHAEIVEWMVVQLPPLEPVAQAIVDNLVTGSRLGTIVGLVGVIWGASGFYGTLDGAFSRMFPGPGARGMVEQRIRGVVGVITLVFMVIAGVVVESILSVVASMVSAPAGIEAVQAIGPVVACLASVAVVFVVLVVVPRRGPSKKAAFWPAVVAGIAIGLLTVLFGALGPLLVKGFAALGVIASVFAALIWLNLVFQMLLYAAAWARIRRDLEVARTTAPTI